MPLCACRAKSVRCLKSLPQNVNNARIQAESNEVPLGIRRPSKKGSMTLEAAVIIPVAALFLAVLLFWFRVLEIETEVYTALNYASRKTAAIRVMSENSTGELALAEGYFFEKLAEAEYADEYLSSAQKLVILAESKVSGDYVDLIADYRIKLPISFFSLKDISIRQECKSRKWIGSKSEDSDDVYVYVTENGTVYHLTKSCRYLELSIQTKSRSELEALRNQNGHKYYECERCAAKNTGQDGVYTTDYGTAYHYSLECSGLKRTVSIVKKSDVEDKKLCSKCAKNSK